MYRIKIFVCIMISCCIGIIVVACGASAEAQPAVEEVFVQDGEFCCAELSWGMSPDEAQDVMDLTPFLEGSEVQGNSDSERSYYTPKDTVVNATFFGSNYQVKPLYEFESGGLKNVSYTFSNLSEIDSDGFLDSISKSFGEYEQKLIDVPSGDKLCQYNWICGTTKCTYSVTYTEEQVIAVSLNVMRMS